MSDSQIPNQAISVFHFTSQISSAKIRKYRMATGKGMAPQGTAIKEALLPSPNGSMPKPSSTPSEEPPSKKPRLRLNVRRPATNDGDTIAVSRPKRASVTRSRYSEDAAETDEEPEVAEAKQSPAASSGLSSLDSTTVSVKEESAGNDAKQGGHRESYGDFMSYYIMDGEDAEEEPKPKPKPKGRPPKGKAVAHDKPRREAREKAVTAQTPVPSADRKHEPLNQPPSSMAPPQQKPRQRLMQQQLAPPVSVPASAPSYQGTSMQTRPLPATRPPQVAKPAAPLLTPAMEEITVKYHASVPEKVKKLEALSMALAGFAGVPAAPKSPPPVVKGKQKIPQPVKTSSDSERMYPSIPVPFTDHGLTSCIGQAPVDNFLAMFDDDDSDGKDDTVVESQFEPDEPQFLTNPGEPDGPLTYGIQFIMNALKSWAEQRVSRAMLANEQSSKYQPHKPLDISDTPEGQAIAAFREVVESGCLQINVVMPAELASAVRHLYGQIDHLINSGNKNQSDSWFFMSYKAQIDAQKSRVDKWKEQQVWVQEEIARQQQFVQWPMMHMGGLPMANGYPPNSHFGDQAHRSADRRRSAPHEGAQSHSRHIPRSSLPAGAAGNTPYSAESPMSSEARAINAGQENPEQNQSTYMPNLLPRSGQTMRFSFAPSNEAAIQAFGAGAFPAIGQKSGSSVPTRGPTSASPSMNEAATPTPPTERLVSGVEDARARSGHDLRDKSTTEAHGHPSPAPRVTSGFTAVNAPARAPKPEVEAVVVED